MQRVNMGIMTKTVTIRVYESTWKRLKIKAVKGRKTLMVLVDELSKKI